MACGENRRDGAAHRIADEIDAAVDAERLQQFGELPVKEVGVVDRGGAVGQTAPEIVVGENR